jgi:hypothetical protein
MKAASLPDHRVANLDAVLVAQRSEGVELWESRLGR